VKKDVLLVWNGVAIEDSTARTIKNPKRMFYGCHLFRLWINLWFPGYYSFFIPGFFGDMISGRKRTQFFLLA
jgi:hypothetical protein